MNLSWKLIGSAAVLAVGTAGTTIALLRKKRMNKKTEVEANPEPSPEAPYAVADLKTPMQGSYSFISGYRNPKMVEVTLTYDADSTSFAELTSGYPVASSCANAAVISHADFLLQMEACSYYVGEWFDTVRQDAETNHPDCTEAVYGSLSGIRYTAGDSICLCFPADDNSYLLLTVLQVKGSDVKLEDIPALPEFAALLTSAKVRVS